MNIDKLYWKSIYYWIKYFNYKLEHTDKIQMKFGYSIRKRRTYCI